MNGEAVKGPTITVYRRVYSWDAYVDGDQGEVVEEGECVYPVDDWLEDHGERVYDGDDDYEGAWVAASRVEVAHAMLTGTYTSFWASECSSSGAEVDGGDNPWWSAEIENRPDGTYVESSAHLDGFTPDELREVYALVMGK